MFVLRWLTGTWSEYSVSCGEEFHSGQAHKSQRNGAGVASESLHPQRPDSEEKPVPVTPVFKGSLNEDTK